MRIAILYAGYISRISGTSERVFQISRELASQGVQVVLSGAVHSRSKQLKNVNLHVVAMPNRVFKLFEILVWITKLIAGGLACRYDVVQLESFPLFRSLILIIILHPFSRRFITVFHDKLFKSNPKTTVSGRINIFLLKALLTLSDISITPGLSVKMFFKELCGESLSRKIVVIPNGSPIIDVKRNSNIRVKYGLDKEAFIALFFGSMTFKPNYEAAISLYRISKLISSKFREATGGRIIFTIAGMGSKLLPRSEHFIPLGFIEGLDELLSIPDIIILPHKQSHSGPHVKTMYSFLSGKPVVATEDAVKDMPYVTPGKHFLIFNIDNPDTLLNVLIKLYNDRSLRENLAANAYLYSRKLSWRFISQIHLKLYKKLLTTKS